MEQRSDNRDANKILGSIAHFRVDEVQQKRAYPPVTGISGIYFRSDYFVTPSAMLNTSEEPHLP